MMTDITLQLDSGGHLVSASDSIIQLTDKRPTELIGKPLRDAGLPETVQGLIEQAAETALRENCRQELSFSHDSCRFSARLFPCRSNASLFALIEPVHQSDKRPDNAPPPSTLENQRLKSRAQHYQDRLRRLADRLTHLEEEERHRIATHIHDTIVQTLALSNVRLGGIRSRIAEQKELNDLCKKVDGVRALLDEGIRECRNLMGELVPSLLYDLGLAAALRELAERHRQLDGNHIEVVETCEMPPLDRRFLSLLFQFTRELINNALKHAGSCTIKVTLDKQDNALIICVQDNGRGFDPDSLEELHSDEEANHGFGLFNIQERLEALKGRFDIQSAPGQGTTGTITLFYR